MIYVFFNFQLSLAIVIAALCLDCATSFHMAPIGVETQDKYASPHIFNSSYHPSCTCKRKTPKMIKANKTHNQHVRPHRSILISVSVNVTGKLKAALRCNKHLVDRTIIITSPEDRQTQRLCKAEKIECHITHAFYRHGDSFNKGRALQEVQRHLHQNHSNAHSIILLVDADICLPSTLWLTMPKKLRNNVLYTSVDRCMYSNPHDYSNGMPAVQGHWLKGTLGMFQAYKWTSQGPLYSDAFPDAARSDYEFARHFKESVILPLFVSHMGISKNWGRDWRGYRGNADQWERAAPPPEGMCPCCDIPDLVKVR